MKTAIKELAAAAGAAAAKRVLESVSKNRRGNIKTERKLIFGTLGLLYLFVAATWAGWHVFYKFHRCEKYALGIDRAADGQTNLIFSAWIFGDRMPDNKKAAVKFYLGKGEASLQKRIELYSEKCRDRLSKDRLVLMLRGYELYLMTKESVYKDTEAAAFDWIRKIKPIELLFE